VAERQPFRVPYTVEGFVTYYNLIGAARGFSMPPHMIPAVRMLLDVRIKKGMIIIGPGSGKSVCLCQMFPAFELGHDPTMTILGISAGEALMQGFQRSVMETIEFAPEYRGLFPRVRPDKSAGWSTERGMFVTGREMGNPDPNFGSAGLDSKSLTGKHGRLILCDDLHDKENAGNINQCDKVWDTWFNTIQGRADPRGARYIVAGRRWNQHDIYARLMASEEWVVLELPAEREGTNELWVDVSVPDDLKCTFTDHLYNDTPPKKRVRLIEKRERVRL
jgi:hypothetical protein